MTPQFTTPCYVQVNDKDKFTEVRDKLYSFGYLLGQYSIDMLDNMIITYPDVANTFCAGSVGMFDKIDLKGRINCSTNIDLFLALAGMRSDTDKGQWFVTDQNEWFVSKYDYQYLYSCERTIDNLNIGLRTVHKATAQEIIEHFKTK